jgi:hypothetical protein
MKMLSGNSDSKGWPAVGSIIHIEGKRKLYSSGAGPTDEGDSTAAEINNACFRIHDRAAGPPADFDYQAALVAIVLCQDFM